MPPPVRPPGRCREAAAQAYASARALKLGQAVSELIRASSAPKQILKKENGVWVFELPANAPRIKASQIKDLQDEIP